MNILYIPSSSNPQQEIPTPQIDCNFINAFEIPKDILSFFVPGADMSALSRFTKNGFPVCIVDDNIVELRSENDLLPYIQPQIPQCCLFSCPLEEESCFCESVFTQEQQIENLIEELQNIQITKLREFGLSEKTLRFIMDFNASPSRMTITKRAQIFLPDYGNCEIRMDDKTKALYLLYLNHPLGLSIKQLPDYADELLSIYQKISGRDDLQAMRNTITNLVDPYKNDINISLSRIKKAFASSLADSLAKNYYVVGNRGGVRTVALNRTLVQSEL